MKNLFQEPLYETPNSGAGGGGGASSFSSSENGTSQSNVGAGSSGGMQPQAYKVTDDSMLDFGDGKPVKWGEARTSRYLPKDAYDRGVEFLTKMASQMDERLKGTQPGQAQRPQSQQHQQTQQTQQQQRPQDPFAAVEDMAVVDGRTLAKIGRQMIQEGMGPMGQVIAQMGAKMAALEKQVATVGQTTGSLAEGHRNTEFESFISNTIKAVPEIKGLGMIPAEDPLIREWAKDIYLSHDQNDKTLAKEFPAMLQERIESSFKLFTRLQKANVERARTEGLKRFANPNRGQASGGNGKPAYQYETPAQLADAFFGAQQGAQT